MVYTVTFTFTDREGGAMSVVKEKVTVRAGATVRGTVRPGSAVPGMPAIVGVHVSGVTRVPLDEAPGAAGPCPASGVRITADDGDAAMGLRVVGLTVVNCGSSPYHLDGYPQLTLLDDGREPVDGVKVVEGGKGVALLDGFDAPPAPVTLAPGQSARAGIMWRNTTGSGTAVNVPYVEVRAKAGAAPVMVTPHLDLGTTGKLGVSAWKPATG
ncbi:DUF4232 domain-containing protein [Streptomyces sp. NPDC090306]|uniref:DUF4232 domain-containing protein n=1 Tax=Streptomyces sp. NPDC090306 TaxID=3365961 RepID=UPI003823EE50